MLSVKSETNPFTIQVDNLKNKEILSYSLALIKGRVLSQSNEIPSNSQIIIQLGDICSKWPLISGHFKCMVHLNKGMNDIAIKYESSVLFLNLEYILRKTDLFVVPIYIVSNDHDGQFQGPDGCNCSIPSARKRILLATKILQATIAEKLWETGLGRQTFMIKEEDGCLLHESALSVNVAQNMKQEELWEHYGRELVLKWGIEEAAKFKFLAFLACTRYSGNSQSSGLLHEQILASTKGHAALGGGGLAIFGTGCLHTWPTSVEEILPCLTDSTPVNQSKLMDDSCYRGTYGGCCSTTMGSVLHELCHTFDLGHTSKGVMGRGFDHMELVLCPSTEECRDVNSNMGVHTTVDFTINLKVKCLVEGNSSLRPSQSSQTDKNMARCCTTPVTNDDQTFFTQSCAFMLAYHKWFNNHPVPAVSEIKFDERSWALRSGSGVRVIEVRSGERQMVQVSWCFSQGRLYFVVPRSALPSSLEKPLLLVAQDSDGQILRHILKL